MIRPPVPHRLVASLELAAFLAVLIAIWTGILLAYAAAAGGMR